MQLSNSWGSSFINNSSTMLRLITISLLGGGIGSLVHYYLLNSANYTMQDMKALGFIGAACLWMLLTYGIYQLTIFIKNILDSYDKIGLRLLIGIIIGGSISFVLNCMYYTYAQSISVRLADGTSWISGDYSKIGIVTSIVSIVCVVIIFAIHTFHTYSEDQIIFLETQRKQIDLRVMALKSQLSPHFLFNGLNTISSLIYTDKEKAENYIRDLYDTYNYALSKYNNDTVTLQDELQLVNSYLGMVNIRYGECVKLSNAIDRGNYHAKVLPFSIQTLVENALKHNIAETDQPLSIRLSMDNNRVTISNNKQLKEKHPSSTGLGHDNLRERYKILGGKKIKVDDSAMHYSVTIPVL